MRVYVKENSGIQSITVEEIFQQLATALTHLDNLSYIKQHEYLGTTCYFTIAFFNEDKTPYLLTIQGGKQYRFVLRKDPSTNTYSAFSCCFEYGVEKILSQDGAGLVDGHQKIFLPTPINIRFTNDRAFSIPFECVPTREAVEAARAAETLEVDSATSSDREDDAVDPFPYLEDWLLSNDQQRRLFYGSGVPECDQFCLTLFTISENFDDPAKILSAVLLNDEALASVNLTDQEKKYIEAKWLPFFELDRIDTISDMPDIKIGNVLFYYQFCVFRQLHQINSALDIPNDSLRDYSRDGKEALIGHLPSDFVSDCVFWEKPPKPVDPTLVSPNAEIIQALSLIFGVNPGGGYETKVAFIQSTLRQYSADQLNHIFNALQDYKATLADVTEQSHFRLDYRATYDHLHVVYPIPARVDGALGSVSRADAPIHDRMSRLLRNDLWDSAEYDEMSRLEDNQMVRLRLSTLVNMSILEAGLILSAYRVEKKIRENPEADIRMEELISLIHFFSPVQLRALLSGEIAKKVVVLLEKPEEFDYLSKRLNSNQLKDFLSLFFEHVMDNDNLYPFFKTLSRVKAELCAKYVPIHRFSDGIKQQGDLINLTLYVPLDKRSLVIDALLQNQRMPALTTHLGEFQTICLYCNFNKNDPLRIRFVEQVAPYLPQIIHNAAEFAQLWNQSPLTDREITSCFLGCIPALSRYFNTMADFAAFNSNPRVPEKIKQRVCDMLLLIHNERVAQHNRLALFNQLPRRDPAVFLSGIHAIANFFQGDGGLSMKIYLESLLSVRGATIDNVVVNVERRVNQLSTLFTAAFRLAVSVFTAKWKAGNVELDMKAICERAAAQTQSQFLTRTGRLISPPLEVVVGSSSPPDVFYRYRQ